MSFYFCELIWKKPFGSLEARRFGYELKVDTEKPNPALEKASICPFDAVCRARRRTFRPEQQRV